MCLILSDVCLALLNELYLLCAYDLARSQQCVPYVSMLARAVCLKMVCYDVNDCPVLLGVHVVCTVCVCVFLYVLLRAYVLSMMLYEFISCVYDLRVCCYMFKVLL